MFRKNLCVSSLGLLIVMTLLLMQGCSGTEVKVPYREGPTAIGTKKEGKVAASANNRFAFRLLAEIAKQEETKEVNIFFSPFSISQCVGMTLFGAAGKTESQIKEALQIPESCDLSKYGEGAAYLAHLLEETAKASDKNKLFIANSLWGEKTYHFSKTYFDTVQDYYGAGTAFPADFKNQSSQERERINKWISTYTASKIKNAIPDNMITEMTRLVLVNTIYFKGQWSEPFEKDMTQDCDFHLSSEKKIQTPVMQQEMLESSYAAFNADGSYFKTPRYMLLSDEPGDSPGHGDEEVPATKENIEEAKKPQYPDKDGFHMVEMPYKGDRLSMIVVAPLSPDGLPQLEKILTAERFEKWVAKLRQRTTWVHLPKFDMSTDYSLVELLESLGMKNAFEMPSVNFDSETEADFSRAVESGKPDLFINTAIHKAVLEVHEKGTEAAATTVFADKCATAPTFERVVPFVPVFEADRPFLFFICDRELHTILFVGRMKKP